jgi:hypothetical protein
MKNMVKKANTRNYDAGVLNDDPLFSSGKHDRQRIKKNVFVMGVIVLLIGITMTPLVVTAQNAQNKLTSTSTGEQGGSESVLVNPDGTFGGSTLGYFQFTNPWAYGGSSGGTNNYINTQTGVGRAYAKRSVWPPGWQYGQCWVGTPTLQYTGLTKTGYVVMKTPSHIHGEQAWVGGNALATISLYLYEYTSSGQKVKTYSATLLTYRKWGTWQYSLDNLGMQVTFKQYYKYKAEVLATASGSSPGGITDINPVEFKCMWWVV